MKDYVFNDPNHPAGTKLKILWYGYPGSALQVSTHSKTMSCTSQVFLSVEDAKKLKKAINKFLKEAEPQ